MGVLISSNIFDRQCFPLTTSVQHNQATVPYEEDMTIHHPESLSSQSYYTAVWDQIEVQEYQESQHSYNEPEHLE